MEFSHCWDQRRCFDLAAKPQPARERHGGGMRPWCFCQCERCTQARLLGDGHHFKIRTEEEKKP